jgi:hypothetical protein
MSVEDRAGKGPNPPSWDISKEINVHVNELFLTQVNDIRNKYADACREKGVEAMTAAGGIKTFIKNESGSETPAIRGFAEVAKGKKLILAITPDQKEPFTIAFNLDAETLVPYYAVVEGTDDKHTQVEEVLIKFGNVMPRSMDSIIISRELSNRLGGEKDQAIKIIKVYHRTSDIDLDEL